jgi:hypothetical protein
MSEWKDGEEGPKCTCGWPTTVSVQEEEVILWCLGHTYEQGAYWKLPSERPDNWPNLTHEEMAVLIESAT